jgi:anaerobic magnesium-protoporphyrin IX monomethyl ester cyclase
MRNNIDLLLLTDEPVAWEGDFWFRSSEKLTQQMKALGFTREDKERVEKKFGIRDYFRPLHDKLGSTDDPVQELFRIRVPHRPHQSVCDLATVVKEAGYEVRVIDNILRYPSRMEQVRELIKEKPKAVGLSTTFLLTEKIVHHYVDIIKDIAPDAKLILGGPSVRKFKNLHNCCDFAVFGDGEDSIIAILEVLDGKRSPDTISHSAYKVNGTVHYGVGGMSACNLGVTAKPYKALKVKIPVSDWTHVHRSFKNVYPIEFSRGCLKNCYYCSYDRGKEIRTLTDIRKELLRNTELGIRRYRVSDSNFTDGPAHHRKYPHDICKLMIELDLGIEWSCYSRVDDMTDELAELMRRAGCFGVFFGVESGDDGVLKKMNKMHTVADAYKGIAIAKKHGFFCHASFIVGYPGETYETFNNTLEFIEKSRPHTVNLGQFRVEHDTIMYGKKEFELEGWGMTWRHKTMDSITADKLVMEGNNRLLKNGICLGTECGYPTFMGLGLSIDESAQTMKDLDVMGLDYKRSKEEFQQATKRLRDLILNRFPEYIKEDQSAWELAVH